MQAVLGMEEREVIMSSYYERVSVYFVYSAEWLFSNLRIFCWTILDLTAIIYHNSVNVWKSCAALKRFWVILRIGNKVQTVTVRAVPYFLRRYLFDL